MFPPRSARFTLLCAGTKLRESGHRLPTAPRPLGARHRRRDRPSRAWARLTPAPPRESRARAGHYLAEGRGYVAGTLDDEGVRGAVYGANISPRTASTFKLVGSLSTPNFRTSLTTSTVRI